MHVTLFFNIYRPYKTINTAIYFYIVSIQVNIFINIYRPIKTINIAIYFYTASMYVTLMLIYVGLLKQLIMLNISL